MSISARVNAWVSPETMASLFPADAEPPGPAELDRVIPHPVYAAQSWVSVLNPGEASAEQARELLREAHRRATVRWSRKSGSERD